MAGCITVCQPPPIPLSLIRMMLQRMGIWPNNDSDRPVMAREVMGSGVSPAVLRPSLAITGVQGSPLTGSGGNIPPLSSETSTLGLPHERLTLTAAGLPLKVIETIQNTRAASKRSLYIYLYISQMGSVGVQRWCADRNIVPY